MKPPYTEPHMRRTIHILAAATVALLLATVTSHAQDFAAAAAKSAEKFKTPAGSQYGVAFMRSTGKTLVPAAQACLDGQYPLGAAYDVVFVVSASGHIDRVLHGPKSAYGECVASHLTELHSAAKPPSAPWPIHVRFLHGRIDRRAPEPPFMVVADDAKR